MQKMKRPLFGVDKNWYVTRVNINEPDPRIERLRNRRVLMVEDEYFIAKDLARALTAVGMEIVGPVPSLVEAEAALVDNDLDFAVLDVALDGDKVYHVADALIARGVPVLFVTGYDPGALPMRYANVPQCLKPIDVRKVVAALAGMSGS